MRRELSPKFSKASRLSLHVRANTGGDCPEKGQRARTGVQTMSGGGGAQNGGARKGIMDLYGWGGVHVEP